MRLSFKILFLLFFCSSIAVASSRLDSLLKLYNAEKVDTSRVRLTLKISKLMVLESPQDSTDLFYLHKSYLNSKLTNYPYLKLKVCRSLGDAYMRFNLFNNALRY